MSHSPDRPALLLSVVIPTRHRNDLLALALDRLAPGRQTGLTLAADDSSLPHYEVIVADDGSESTAETMLFTRYPWARWIQGPRKGPAANRNRGAKAAQGEWLVFLDDDCLPEATLLSAYAAVMREAAGAKVLEGRIYTDRPRRSLAESAPTNETGGFLWSCNCAVRADLFEALHGFEERFPFAAMEDVDFRERLVEQKIPFRFVPEAAVCHPWRILSVRKKMREREISFGIYLSLRPERSPALSGRVLFYSLLRGFLRVTLPGSIRFRGAGLKEALHEHACELRYLLRRAWVAGGKPRRTADAP